MSAGPVTDPAASPPAAAPPAGPTGVGGAAPEAGAPSGAGTSKQALRGWWQRWRWIFLVAVVLLLAALITALASRVNVSDVRFGPENPAPGGSRALAQVLAEQGVDIQVVRRSTAAVQATGDRSTLLVTNPGLLQPDQLERLVTDDAANLVLVEPDEIVLSRLAPQVRTAGRVPAVLREPQCRTPAAQAAGAARAGGQMYLAAAVPGGEPLSTGVCYTDPTAPQLGSYLSSIIGDRTVTVIGQSDILTNEYLAQDGNAALSLWTLGANPDLVWYLPDPLEPSSSPAETNAIELLPEWVFWLVVQLAIVALVAIGWRARRLGRLVPEPLPVLVRAAETQEGRARLYRQSSARGRAAATLRTTCLRRLASRLAVPTGTTPAELIPILATALGRDQAGETVLYDLLLGPAPRTDAALVTLADDLDAIEHALAALAPGSHRLTSTQLRSTIHPLEPKGPQL